MNADHPSPRAGDPFPWLAGHADGELDPATRRQVDDWLAADPTAADLLREQQRFSPANTAYWLAVDPPSPDERGWERVRAAVSVSVLGGDRTQTHPDRNRRRGMVRAGLAVAAVVGITVIGLWFGTGHRSDSTPTSAIELAGNGSKAASIPAPVGATDPLADLAVLPTADDSDVFVTSVVAGSNPDPIGYNSPWPERIDLAGADDVAFAPASEGRADRRASLEVMTGRVPMVFAARR